MADSIVPRKNMFPKVAEAKEALKGRALAMAEKYEQAIDAAMKKGEFEVAIKAMQWFLEHVPAQDGIRVIDPSIDKAPAPDKGPKGPRIQIGIKLGDQGPRLKPVNEPEAIPAEFTVKEEDDENK